MIHCFSVEIGVNPAIIFHHVKYWIINRVKAFKAQFPELTERQIKRALEVLVYEKYLEKGNFNPNKFNRTRWYALGEKGARI